MTDRAPALRRLTLLLVGALVVHRLRYAAGYHGGAEDVLAAQGHAYLGAAGAIVLLLGALAASRFAAGLAGPRRARSEALPHFLHMWAAASAALAGVFVMQELAEGALGPAHAAGLTGVFADGGWTGLVFAVLVGGLFALAERGAAAALAADPALAASRGSITLATPWHLPTPPPGHLADAANFGLRARGPPLPGS